MINHQYKSKSIFFGLIVTFAAATLGMFFSYQNIAKELAHLKESNRVLEQKEIEMTETIHDLETRIADMNKRPTVIPNDAIVEKLKGKGLADINKDLIVDLGNKKNLIKHPPVLGGAMHFSEEGIYVLTDRWVLAEFEDGHIYGYMLLEYDINKGKIHWKVIDSYLFQ